VINMNSIARLALLSIGLVVAAFVAGGCDERSSGGGGGGASAPAASGGKLRVAATTTMIGDIARRIGGDRVELKVIMGPGVDPHTFKPAPGDIAELRRAQLVLYNGLHLEGKMVQVFEDTLKDKSVAVGEAIPEGRLLSWTQGGGGAHDPHVWFDVQLWSLAAQKICDALAEKDAAGADDYRRRAAELTQGLQSLDQYARQKLATVPKDKRVLVTSHDAYGYFGKAYDVEVRGLQGISTETEAGIQAINSAVDFILQRKIPAVFVESSVSHKTIERVQADCKARGFNVAIGGELYSDAMGQPGEHPGYEVHTYEGMVRYNVDTIVKALSK
jgi:manganese/zinc/iron transport system substrate-binding protein